MAEEGRPNTDQDINVPLAMAIIGGIVFFLTGVRQDSIGILSTLLGAVGAFLITFVVVWAGVKVYRALSRDSDPTKPFDRS